MKLFRIYETCYNAGEKISNCVYAEETTRTAEHVFNRFLLENGFKAIDPPTYSHKHKRHTAAAFNTVYNQPVNYEIIRIW